MRMRPLNPWALIAALIAAGQAPADQAAPPSKTGEAGELIEFWDAGELVDVWDAGGKAQLVEVGDAGELQGTAQEAGSGTDLISGSIFQIGDIDLYKIHLPNVSLQATTVGRSNVDTQLYLFDAMGFGIVGNDDAGDQLLQSTISADLAAGTYFLGISAFNYDPVSTTGFIFPDTDDFGGDPLFFPTDVGGGDPMTGWAMRTTSITTGVGNYGIALNVLTVPEPSPTVLFLTGMLVVWGFSLRKLY